MDKSNYFSLTNYQPFSNSSEEQQLEDINYLKEYVHSIELIYQDKFLACKTLDNTYFFISSPHAIRLNSSRNHWLWANDELFYPEVFSRQLAITHQYIINKHRVVSLSIFRYGQQYSLEMIHHRPIVNPKSQQVVGESLEYYPLFVQDRLNLLQKNLPVQLIKLKPLLTLSVQDSFILLLLNLNFSYSDILNILNSYYSDSLNLNVVKVSVRRIFKILNVASLKEARLNYNLDQLSIPENYLRNLNIILLVE